LHAPLLLHAPAATFVLPLQEAVPHGVVAGRLLRFVHVGVPLLQSVFQTWHSTLVLHAASWTHVLHSPALHTALLPQEVPFVTLAQVPPEPVQA
jgi:hypothetical protein